MVRCMKKKIKSHVLQLNFLFLNKTSLENEVARSVTRRRVQRYLRGHSCIFLFRNLHVFLRGARSLVVSIIEKDIAGKT